MDVIVQLQRALNEEKQILRVFPSVDDGLECRFNRNGTGEISIFNPNKFKVAFKIRRTLPEFVNIHPGYGYVQSQECKIIKVEVGKIKQEDTVAHSEHRVSVLACQAPDVCPHSAKDVWRTSSSPFTSKISIPLKFKINESSESESSESSKVSSSRTRETKSSGTSLDTESSKTSSNTSNSSSKDSDVASTTTTESSSG